MYVQKVWVGHAVGQIWLLPSGHSWSAERVKFWEIWYAGCLGGWQYV